MLSWQKAAVACLCLIPIQDLYAQRPLAPGVLKVIPPHIDPRDAVSLPMPLPGLEASDYQPNYASKSDTLFGQTRQIMLYRDVWQLELAFPGLRQLEIVARDPDGNSITQNVWYFMFRLRNVGIAVNFDDVEEPRFGHTEKQINLNPRELDTTTLHGRFFGEFSLEGWVQDPATAEYQAVRYADSVDPAIVRIIQNEEDPDRPLLDKVQLAKQILRPVSTDTDLGGVWGVAVWYDVDPRIDFVSVKVSGLTNAYRIVNLPDGRKDFVYKTLQLNFWRPGNELDESKDVVDFGIPLVDKPEDQIEIAERYDLPGPVLRGYLVNEDSQRQMLLFEADAELRPLTFESAAAGRLDGGELDEKLRRGFTDAGITLGETIQVNSNVDGQEWTVNDTSAEGVDRTFVIRLEPIFWEKAREGGIRFIKSLDHLWIYR